MHKVTRIRDQRGPEARCGETGCEARPVQWDTLKDEWIHKYTPAELRALEAKAAEALVEMMVGTARQLSMFSNHPSVDPVKVESYLRGAR